MDRRLALHEKLVEILGSDKVYYQPLPSLKLSYPCIVYERNPGEPMYADNFKYIKMNRFQVTLIARHPEDLTRTKIEDLPFSRHESRLVSDNLYHDIFDVYY